MNNSTDDDSHDSKENVASGASNFEINEVPENIANVIGDPDVPVIDPTNRRLVVQTKRASAKNRNDGMLRNSTSSNLNNILYGGRTSPDPNNYMSSIGVGSVGSDLSLNAMSSSDWRKTIKKRRRNKPPVVPSASCSENESDYDDTIERPKRTFYKPGHFKLKRFDRLNDPNLSPIHGAKRRARDPEPYIGAKRRRLDSEPREREVNYGRMVCLEQFSGAYEWPMVHRLIPDISNRLLFPDDVESINLDKRPPVTSLQCIAEAFVYAWYLESAAEDEKAKDIIMQMHNFLLFQSYFLGNFRRFAAMAKPLTSFIGETYDVDNYNQLRVSGLLEQVTPNWVALHFRGRGYTFEAQFRPRHDGRGYFGRGECHFARSIIAFNFNFTIVRNIDEKSGKPVEYLEGKLAAETDGIFGDIRFAEHSQKIIEGVSKNVNTGVKMSFSGARAGGVYLERNERENSVKIEPVTRRQKKAFFARLQSVALDNLPRSDSRLRKDIEALVNNNISDAEHHYERLCIKNLAMKNCNASRYFTFNNGRFSMIKEDDYFVLKDMRHFEFDDSTSDEDECF